MTITDEQRLINALFFEKTFRLLNDGGVWEGDDGKMRKVNDLWFANLETYEYIARLTPKQWFNRSVVLYENPVGSPMCDLFTAPIALLYLVAHSIKSKKGNFAKVTFKANK